ncbi:MAG: hypothetical protein VB875_15990 [Pirellulales bacterium]
MSIQVPRERQTDVGRILSSERDENYANRPPQSISSAAAADAMKFLPDKVACLLIRP